MIPRRAGRPKQTTSKWRQVSIVVWLTSGLGALDVFWLGSIFLLAVFKSRCLHQGSTINDAWTDYWIKNREALHQRSMALDQLRVAMIMLKESFDAIEMIVQIDASYRYSISHHSCSGSFYASLHKMIEIKRKPLNEIIPILDTLGSQSS